MTYDRGYRCGFGLIRPDHTRITGESQLLAKPNSGRVTISHKPHEQHVNIIYIMSDDRAPKTLIRSTKRQNTAYGGYSDGYVLILLVRR